MKKFHKIIAGYKPYSAIDLPEVGEHPTAATAPDAININGILTLPTYEPEEPNTFEIYGSVQPATSQDLLLLPAGRRQERTAIVYTYEELKVGWHLIIFDKDFEILGVQVWQNNLIEHYRALLVEQNGY